MVIVKKRRRREEWLQGHLAVSSRAAAGTGTFPLFTGYTRLL